MTAAEETIGMPVAVDVTGRCPCGARVVYLRGQHQIRPYSLLSTNGMASGIHLKLTDGRPKRHRCLTTSFLAWTQ